MEELDEMMMSLGNQFNKMHVDNTTKYINHKYLTKLDTDIELIKSELSSNVTPLYIMCKYGLTEIMKWYIINKNLNEIYEYNDTPLHIAVKYNQINTVELLCANNITVNISNLYNLYPIDYAIKTNNIEMIKLLLLSGADINLSFHNAIYYSNNSILAELLKYNIKYITLENALHIAYKNNNTFAIDLLIHHIET